MILRVLSFACLWLTLFNVANADIVVTIGEQDFSNGQSLAISTYNSAQANDSSNGLNSSYFEFRGADLNSDTPGNWNDTISFSGYGTLSNIESAVLTVGLWDHDSAAAGDQVRTFSLEGVNLTSGFNALLNSSGGVQDALFTSEYNVYEFALDPITFAALADGSADFQLEFQNGRSSADTTYNGVGLDFAELRIMTAVPEPTQGLWVVLVVSGTFLAVNRRVRKSEKIA